ncbi:electron transport complex subunit RsxA [Mycoplasmatota bacterium]|nr:electron transport complex subunit RsxA [Mycoplasmatota bacterium]
MNASDLIKLGIEGIIIQNVILTQFLGICPFMGISKKSQSAIGMGLAVIFVMLISSIVTFAINDLILEEQDLGYLQTIVFILVISGVVQFVEMFIKKTAPIIYKMLGIYLPLITTNCAILGIALINVKPEKEFGYPEMIAYTIGISIGFTLVIYIFSTIRERLENANVPKAFKGAPIALITAGIMSIIFLGFAGLV